MKVRIHTPVTVNKCSPGMLLGDQFSCYGFSNPHRAVDDNNLYIQYSSYHLRGSLWKKYPRTSIHAII